MDQTNLCILIVVVISIVALYVYFSKNNGHSSQPANVVKVNYHDSAVEEYDGDEENEEGIENFRRGGRGGRGRWGGRFNRGRRHIPSTRFWPYYPSGTGLGYDTWSSCVNVFPNEPCVYPRSKKVLTTSIYGNPQWKCCDSSVLF
jgi:hypothetical protein